MIFNSSEPNAGTLEAFLAGVPCPTTRSSAMISSSYLLSSGRGIKVTVNHTGLSTLSLAERLDVLEKLSIQIKEYVVLTRVLNNL
jgi:hypothetical protein